jgi:hypothetical protein
MIFRLNILGFRGHKVMKSVSELPGDVRDRLLKGKVHVGPKGFFIFIEQQFIYDLF